MPLVTIHNRLQTKLVLPMVKLEARGSATLNVTARELDSLVEAANSGAIAVSAMQDSNVDDALELATLANLSAIGVVEVTLSAEVADAITVTCALKDLSGRAIEEVRGVMVQSIADSDLQGSIGESLPPDRGREAS